MLLDKTVAQFIEDLATDFPTPSGGSVCACAGAMAAGVLRMVGRVILSQRSSPGPDDELVAALAELERLQRRLTALIDLDNDSFHMIVNFRGKEDAGSAADNAARKQAAETPREVAFLCLRLLECAEAITRNGDPALDSDAVVAVELALACLRGAIASSRINISMPGDGSYGSDLLVRLEHWGGSGCLTAERVRLTVRERSGLC